MEPRDLILDLCREAGDDMGNPERTIGDFLANHSPETAEDVVAAAGGDVAALVRVRTQVGLPIVR